MSKKVVTIKRAVFVQLMYKLISTNATITDLLAYSRTLLMTYDVNVTSTHNAYNISTDVALDTTYFAYYYHNNMYSRLKLLSYIILTMKDNTVFL